MVCKQRPAFEVLPIEPGVGFAAGYEKPVASVDLREMDGQRLDSAFSRLPIRGHRRLHDIDLAVADQAVGALARPEYAVMDFVPFVLKKSNTAQKRAVERGVARRHDAKGHPHTHLKKSAGPRSAPAAQAAHLSAA